MPQNERRPAAANSQAPILKPISSPILTGFAPIEKRYLRDLVFLCIETALSGDAAVLKTTLQLFKRVPAEMRRMRRERVGVTA